MQVKIAQCDFEILFRYFSALFKDLLCLPTQYIRIVKKKQQLHFPVKFQKIAFLLLICTQISFERKSVYFCLYFSSPPLCILFQYYFACSMFSSLSLAWPWLECGGSFHIYFRLAICCSFVQKFCHDKKLLKQFFQVIVPAV